MNTLLFGNPLVPFHVSSINIEDLDGISIIHFNTRNQNEYHLILQDTFGPAGFIRALINSHGKILEYAPIVRKDWFSYDIRSVDKAVITSDKGVIFLASNIPTTNAFNASIVRFNTAGEQLWVKKFGKHDRDIGINVIENSDNSYLIIGTTASFKPNYGTLYLEKINSNGDTVWTRAYPAIFNLGGTFPVVGTSDGGLAISVSGNDNNHVFIKLDKYYNVSIHKTTALTSGGMINFLEETRDNGFITGGTGGAFFIRMDSLGNILWSVNEQDVVAKGPITAAMELEEGGFLFGVKQDFFNRQYLKLVRLLNNGEISWTLGHTCNCYLTPAGFIQTAANKYELVGSPRERSGSIAINTYQEIPAPEPISAVMESRFIQIRFINQSSFAANTLNDILFMDESNLEDYFKLNDGHTFLDEAGKIGSISWSSDTSALNIELSSDKTSITGLIGETVTFVPTGKQMLIRDDIIHVIQDSREHLTGYSSSRFIPEISADGKELIVRSSDKVNTLINMDLYALSGARVEDLRAYIGGLKTVFKIPVKMSRQTLIIRIVEKGKRASFFKLIP